MELAPSVISLTPTLIKSDHGVKLTVLVFLRQAPYPVQDIRDHVSRLHINRQHALMPILNLHKLGEAYQRRLRSLISAHNRPEKKTTNAHDVDDGFIAALQHQRQESARDEIWAPEIDRPCLPPGIRIAVHNGGGPAQDASVVDYNVNLPKLPLNFLHCALDARAIAYVLLHGHNFWRRTIIFHCCGLPVSEFGCAAYEDGLVDKVGGAGGNGWVGITVDRICVVVARLSKGIRERGVLGGRHACFWFRLSYFGKEIENRKI